MRRIGLLCSASRAFCGFPTISSPVRVLCGSHNFYYQKPRRLAYTSLCTIVLHQKTKLIAPLTLCIRRYINIIT